MENNRKITAAITAVAAYLQEEEAMMMAPPVEEEAPEAPAILKMWALSGRQSQMQLRNMMQMKAFHGSNIR